MKARSGGRTFEISEERLGKGRGGVVNHATDTTHVPGAKATTVTNRRGSEPPNKNREPGINPAPAPFSCPVSLSFTVFGVPIGKPRMTRSDKWKQRPCVLRYRDFADRVREVAGLTKKLTLRYPTTIAVAAYFLGKNDEYGPYCKKPDGDNILKAVCDALVANDEMIYEKRVYKFWGTVPRITVEFRQVPR
jgi:Holliday junction resolvase RusA-like endonuclease